MVVLSLSIWRRGRGKQSSSARVSRRDIWSSISDLTRLHLPVCFDASLNRSGLKDVLCDGVISLVQPQISNRASEIKQEHQTIDAIVRASEYPLSIVLVGVGDGPWHTMRQFDDNIAARAFDNFQFLNFTDILSKNINPERKEAEFAFSALMEIPSQYKATLELGLLGIRRRRTGNCPNRIALPPPTYATQSMRNSPRTSRSTSFQNRSPQPYDSGVATAPLSHARNDGQLCPICLVIPKNMAFNCGHQTCSKCGEDLNVCPIFRSSISVRIKFTKIINSLKS